MTTAPDHMTVSSLGSRSGCRMPSCPQAGKLTRSSAERTETGRRVADCVRAVEACPEL